MLSEQAAKTLGYTQQFKHKINNPSFVVTAPVWHKSKCEENIPGQIKKKKHIFSYYKIGKTFGFETKRFIQYYNSTLLYFQSQNDDQQKGYCKTQNLYMYYIKLSNKQQLLHLTNGTQCSQFYFNENYFYKNFAEKLKKDVIQLNFYEKYYLQDIIGKGTYSKVYLAKNKQTSQQFAVKVVYKKDKNGNCTKNIVEQQKKIFRILNCQYVCRMEQFFQDDDSFIFVLEFLNGRDLMSIFRDKVQLSFKKLIAIFKGVLEGLVHLHKNNIIHRDLKPQNIMVDEVTLKPKIIDFGLSLICSPKTDKKRFKRCGTMGYMAYEVIHNTIDKKKTYDSKCDMFSFGIIAHMLLLGYNPIKGKNYNETVQKNQECNIVLQKQFIIEKYGYSCLNFLNGLLQTDPTKRLSSQQALKCQFINQEFKQFQSVLKHQVQQTTQQKQDEAQFENDDQQITIPKFQNFIPNKINMQNRS